MMTKTVITIEVERNENNNKASIKIGDDTIFTSEIESLFRICDGGLIENIKRLLCEIDNYGTFDISKYRNGFRD